jgi:hypothetical protein
MPCSGDAVHLMVTARKIADMTAGSGLGLGGGREGLVVGQLSMLA